MGTEFRITAIESDSDNRPPYDTRLVCVADDEQKRLVIWGQEDQMANVEAVRRATLPCVVSCDWKEPPEFARARGEVAWVHPTDYLRVL